MSAIRRRTSIRMRLTLVFGALFYLAGALVVGVTYLLVSHTLNTQFREMNQTTLIALGNKQMPPTKPLGVDASGGPFTVADLQAQITYDQDRALDSTLDSLLVNSLIATGVVGVLAIGAGWLAAGRLVRPLRTITATARGIAESNLHERIRLGGPADELRELADTFDEMVQRLDRAFDGQRRFVANASHELRTPVAVARTLIQVAMGRPDASPDLRQVAGQLLEVNEKQVRITESLLTLARSEEALTDMVPVDLADLAAAAIASVASRAAATGVRWETDLSAAPTMGDQVLLGQLVDNVLRNCVQYNVAGGTAWVSTGAGPDAWLTVANTGAVLDPVQVAEIFEPFRRLGRQRTSPPADAAGGTEGGFGLGLSIVRTIVRAHRGSVEAHPREGGGLVVRVRLPIAAGRPPVNG